MGEGSNRVKDFVEGADGRCLTEPPEAFLLIVANSTWSARVVQSGTWMSPTAHYQSQGLTDTVDRRSSAAAGTLAKLPKRHSAEPTAHFLSNMWP